VTHLNGDVSNLCGWSSFKNKTCVSCSCLELALTLGVIPSESVESSCSPYFYLLSHVLLATRKLIGSYTYHPGSRSTFPQRLIQIDWTYPDPKPDISGVWCTYLP
jgi:hypothetical protein